MESPVHAEDLHACLPVALQESTTIISRIAAGMSGAGVYRVAAGDERFVLKITARDEPVDVWRRTVQVQQSAAAAGIAPQVFHVDESRRAVLSELVVDRSFSAQVGSPATREAAVTTLGQMLGRLHALPIPLGLATASPREVLSAAWHAFPSEFVLPAFVHCAVAELLDDTTPEGTRDLVMSHNDVNPSNLVFDGERVMLLDWQTAARNDPHYDLGAIAMFYRFDDASCCRLIAAHNGAPVDALPVAFSYHRRVAAVLSGVAALNAARVRGHGGSDVAAELTPSLGEVYGQLRNGTFDLGCASGQWTFGLALVKASMTVH